jgi:hypothetical protein
MFRKLTFLALVGGAVAYFLKQRSAGELTETTPAPQQAAAATAEPPREAATTAAAEAATADTAETEAIGQNGGEEAADDPLVQEQEAAAAAEAASIGGDADTVTADVEPEMRPVVEGSGDAEETFESTEDQGR